MKNFKIIIDNGLVQPGEFIANCGVSSVKEASLGSLYGLIRMTL